MTELIFLKLGGSLITDKDRPFTPRLNMLKSLASQIADTLSSSDLKIIVGHGSGSFGHVAAKKHGTRDGVHDKAGWDGFAEVWLQASELNRFVVRSLHEAGIPAVTFSPSASAIANDGAVASWETLPIRSALANGLVPVIHGDVIFDEARGGTILSTEELFASLAGELRPNRILLAGLEAGVWENFPEKKKLLNAIQPQVYEKMRTGVGKSASADVTGGMAAKVELMLRLVRENPNLVAQIFSGEADGNLARALKGENVGTRITM